MTDSMQYTNSCSPNVLEPSFSCEICSDLKLRPTQQEPLCIELNLLRLEALKDAKSCTSCLMLWRCICSVMEDPRPDKSHSKLLIDAQEHREMLGCGPLVGHVTSAAPYFKSDPSIQFYTFFDDAPSPWSSIGKGYHIMPYALSPSCISLIHKWLRLCNAGEAKHTNCKIPSGPPLLPTRVIYVGDTNSILRLHLSKPNERGWYAALSHCWGGTVPIKTLTSNINHLTRLLPEDSLPQTFKDAISVTRAVGIDYLWIDSLCIIQDSREDWEIQANSMAHVYAEAYITIAADAAPDSYSGFLNVPSRQAPSYKSVYYNNGTSLNNTNADGLHEVIHARKRGFLAEELPFHFWGSSQETSGRSNLSKRGWVFQERLLSPRTVHFSTHEMAWECRSVCDCECSAMSLRTLRKSSVVKDFLYPRQLNLSKFEASWWRDIVPAYTRLELTVKTDRLPAIAGLSQMAKTIRGGDEFLVGLWRRTLVTDLLWRLGTSSGGSRIHPIDYAPSWSWASVTGTIYGMAPDIQGMDSTFSVLDVLPKDSAPRCVVGKCPVVSVFLHKTGGNPVQVGYGSRNIDLEIVWDCYRGENANWASDVMVYKFLIFGISKKGNGPTGLLVVPSQNSKCTAANYKLCFRRVGFVKGFTQSRKIRGRTWGSDGWDSEDEMDYQTMSKSQVAWLDEVKSISASIVNII